MARYAHEIRDPIHTFIRLDDDERRVLDSRPFQRLRYIHQLATTYLVYPGATHRRFEHSLGVMELASRVFDVVTDPDNVRDELRSTLAPLAHPDQKAYWRRVVRMAALCHDIGHLPFSHAAEDELLPNGWDHECLTRALVSSDEMQDIWRAVTPPLRHEEIEKLAVGPKKAPDLKFSYWEEILAEIITGDAFGVDRIDYLLRDSHHAGVAYGKFDHYRLIDTLRILPAAQTNGSGTSEAPALGMEEGGIQSAEALMLARYFMYSQIYMHRVRRIYDIHLKDFLKSWLDAGAFSTELDDHIEMTDNEIMSALWKAANEKDKPEYIHARRIVCRDHFKTLYERNPKDLEINADAGRSVFEAAKREFGVENFRHDSYGQKSNSSDFPVLRRDGRIESSLVISETLKNVPIVAIDYVFAKRSCIEAAQEWLKRNHDDIVKPEREDESDDEQNA